MKLQEEEGEGRRGSRPHDHLVPVKSSKPRIECHLLVSSSPLTSSTPPQPLHSLPPLLSSPLHSIHPLQPPNNLIETNHLTLDGPAKEEEDSPRHFYPLLCLSEPQRAPSSKRRDSCSPSSDFGHYQHSLPPPPSVVIPSRRPRQTPATYTIKQFLAHPPQLPSPASGFSSGILLSRAKLPTHKSTAASDKYDPIFASSLYLVPNLRINDFRATIDSMDGIRFPQPMALPWDASPMLSEACVSSHLDVQILGVAWQAVLQMLPDERDYDLRMVKQVPQMV